MNIEIIKSFIPVLWFFATLNTASIILGYMIVSAFRDILIHIADIKKAGKEKEQ